MDKTDQTETEEIDLTIKPLQQNKDEVVNIQETPVRLEIAKTHEEYLAYLRGEDFKNVPLSKAFNKGKYASRP